MDVVNPLMLELLGWVSRETRTYEKTMEAWRTNCPRQSVWEDALVDGLVRVDRGGGEAMVVLTESGWSALEDCPDAPSLLRTIQCSQIRFR